VTAVSDSIPLLHFAQIGRFDLLRRLFGELYIPKQVCSEVSSISQLITTAKWIRVMDAKPSAEILRERLKPGHSEAFALAIELQANWLLTDEARLRNVAKARGIEPLSTIDVLLLAKQGGLVSSITPLLNNLQTTGYNISADVFQDAQRVAGELNISPSV
jgi:hypothetical protein